MKTNTTSVLAALVVLACGTGALAAEEDDRGFVRTVAGTAILVDASAVERAYLDAGHDLAPGDGLFVAGRSVVEVLFGNRARLVAASDTQLWRAPAYGPVDLELGVGKVVLVTGPADIAVVHTGNATVTLAPGTRVAVTRSLHGDDRVAVAEGQASVDTPDTTFVLPPGYAAWAHDGTNWRSGPYASWRKGAWTLAPGWRLGRKAVLVRMAVPDWDSIWVLVEMVPAWENPRFVESWASCYALYASDHCLDRWQVDYYRWYSLHGSGASPDGDDEDDEEDDAAADDGGTKELPEGPYGPDVATGPRVPSFERPPAVVEVRDARGRTDVRLTYHRDVETGLLMDLVRERYVQVRISRQARSSSRGSGAYEDDSWREGAGSSSGSSSGSSWSSSGSSSDSPPAASSWDSSRTSVQSMPMPSGSWSPSRPSGSRRSSNSKKK